ncbi:MAG TPA: hypothetical protein VFB25_00870 [Gaiellaceae bacterium]|nr:hypothetical protein [Gaiellaceae bacterium]
MALVAAAVVGVGVWAFVIRPGGSSPSASASTSRDTNAHAATAAGLRATAAALGQPIYWLGPQARMTYELTVTTGRLVYVRYLPHGVKPGDPKPDYVTVGTYPKQGAYAIVAAARKLKGSRVQEFGANEIAVTYSTRPKSVYVAYRGLPYMIEVFDPAALGSETIVRDGLLVPLR